MTRMFFEIPVLFILLTRYELNTSTYGYIIPEKSYHSLVSCGVKVTIRKQEIGAMWTRFIHSPLNQPWLTRDFNYWMVDDDSDDDKKLEPIVDPSRNNMRIIEVVTFLSEHYLFI